MNFYVSHPICGTLLWQPMQTNAVSRLKEDAWFLEPRGEAFSTHFRSFSEGPRASLGFNIQELPGKKLKRKERLPPALLLSFIFSDSDILKMKGNRSHILCGYWGVLTITVPPRLIMTLGTIRSLSLSLRSLGFPSHNDWAWMRSSALHQVGTSDEQMPQPCPASCWHPPGELDKRRFHWEDTWWEEGTFSEPEVDISVNPHSQTEHSRMMKCSLSTLSSMVGTSHVWLLSPWNVTSWLNFNLNSSMGLAVTESTAADHPKGDARPRGIGWRGRWEGGSGWGIHVYPRLIHVNVWQKPLQYCKAISLQLIKIKKEKQKNEKRCSTGR